MTTHHNPASIFLSYVHQDEQLLHELETHLSLLKRQGLISTWYNRQIAPGTNWTREIEQQLEQAAIILLLVSADFLASDHCYYTEMERALERHQAGQAQVLPILLRPADLKDAPFAHLQPLPTDAKPITLWPNRDRAFVDVVAGIRRAIQTQQHTTQFTPANTFPTIWNVPYPRNPYFTGREDILSRLSTALQTGQPVTIGQTHAISGLGGIGKTQIAIEYAYRHRHDYQAVLWLRAETRDELISGCVALADLLQLPERQEKEQIKVLQAVKHWLTTHHHWLFILDNADDLSLVHEILPPTCLGHILLTTRASSTGSLANRIEVETLDLEEGTRFLLHRARLLDSDASAPTDAQQIAQAQELVQEMDGLPLALDQAGAYIEEIKCSISHYLSLYRTHRARLLQERGDLVTDHPEPVATTWSLSFRKIAKQSKAAADLLQACAFLQPDAIPEEILREAGRHLGRHIQKLVTNLPAFDQALRLLLSYSLIRRNANEEQLSIHRLVQAVLIDGMNKQTQHEWAARIVSAVYAVLPSDGGDHRQWKRYERCLVQARGCVALIDQWQVHTTVAFWLLYQTGRYLYERARYTEAEPLYQRAIEIGEQTWGSECSDVAYPLNSLAILYQQQGKYGQAEPLYQQALRIWEQTLGPKHSMVAAPLNNLANLYKEQGKYDEAEPLYLRALHIWEQALGPKHSMVAAPLDNLADLYYLQEEYKETEKLYQRALQIRQLTLGSEHPDVAYSLHGLANLYYMQGKYEQAEPLYEQALQIRERALGCNHPRTRGTVKNYVKLLRATKRDGEADKLEARFLPES
jgi:tetratricopeptide (TPR) repeat protein